MPVLASIEVIWVVIIIGSVIAQIIKGAKKVASQSPEKPTGGGEASGGKSPAFVAPDVALQDFLRSLGGEKPSATPVRRGLAQASRPKVPSPQPKRTAAREVKMDVFPLPAPAIIPARREGNIQRDVKLETFAKRETSASVLGDAIRKDLSDGDTLRKAIVLREVLGPPVALR